MEAATTGSEGSAPCSERTSALSSSAAASSATAAAMPAPTSVGSDQPRRSSDTSQPLMDALSPQGIWCTGSPPPVLRAGAAAAAGSPAAGSAALPATASWLPFKGPENCVRAATGELGCSGLGLAGRSTCRVGVVGGSSAASSSGSKMGMMAAKGEMMPESWFTIGRACSRVRGQEESGLLEEQAERGERAGRPRKCAPASP